MSPCAQRVLGSFFSSHKPFCPLWKKPAANEPFYPAGHDIYSTIKKSQQNGKIPRFRRVRGGGELYTSDTVMQSKYRGDSEGVGPAALPRQGRSIVFAGPQLWAISTQGGLEGYILSAQLGCRSGASCLDLVTPRAVERAGLVPIRSASEEAPSNSLQLSCCQLGQFHLFTFGTKQQTSEFLLLGVRRWGNGEKSWQVPCQMLEGNTVM